MEVRFKRSFFIEGHMFASHGAVEVPDRFADRLPSDAEIVGAKPKPVAEPDPQPDPQSDDWHPENWGLIPGNERSKLTRAYNKADKAGDAEARQAVVEEAKKAATGAASAGVTVTADTNQESSTPAQTEGAS